MDANLCSGNIRYLHINSISSILQLVYGSYRSGMESSLGAIVHCFAKIKSALPYAPL